MAEDLTPDLCVIGGGPAGLAVATGAARLGVPTVLIEKGRLGGALLNAGGVANLALQSAAMTRDRLRRAPATGVTGAPLQVNLSKVRDFTATVESEVAATMSMDRLRALDVNVVEGDARFLDARTVEAGDRRVRARRFVVAVGTRAEPWTIDGLDGIDHLTPETALDLGRKPSHVIVLSDEPYGFPLVQAYARLGIDATLVGTAHPLPDHDREQVEIVTEHLREEGIRLRFGMTIASAAKRRGGFRVTLGEAHREATGGTTVEGSGLVVAGRRAPDLDRLDLAAAGVERTADGVVVDRSLRTANRRVYAIGDAVPGPRSVARARAEAARVLYSIVHRLPSRGATEAARIVHTDPGIAAVGATEDDARARHEGVRVVRYPVNAVVRAHIERTPHGAVKAVVSPRGRVIGASIVATGADEMLAPWSLAVARRLPVEAVATMSVGHPSLAEASVMAAAEAMSLDLTPAWQQRMIRALRIFG